MKIEESRRRQETLEKYLKELSTKSLNEESIADYALKFKQVYGEGFRHNYARFFPLVVEIFEEDNEYNQDYLTTNLETMRTIVERDYFEKEGRLYVGLYRPLTKLADHINLETGRYAINLVHEDELKMLEKSSEKIQNQLIASEEKLKKVQEDTQKSQREYVTILGIFAAIVLAFTGGITFSSSVLENISASSIYRMIAISLIIGLVLVNILFFLFHCVERIVRDRDNAKENRFSLVFANVIILLLLAGNIIAWYYGFVESRNEKFDPTDMESSYVTDDNG